MFVTFEVLSAAAVTNPLVIGIVTVEVEQLDSSDDYRAAKKAAYRQLRMQDGLAPLRLVRETDLERVLINRLAELAHMTALSLRTSGLQSIEDEMASLEQQLINFRRDLGR